MAGIDDERQRRAVRGAGGGDGVDGGVPLPEVFGARACCRLRGGSAIRLFSASNTLSEVGAPMNGQDYSSDGVQFEYQPRARVRALEPRGVPGPPPPEQPPPEKPPEPPALETVAGSGTTRRSSTSVTGGVARRVRGALRASPP